MHKKSEFYYKFKEKTYFYHNRTQVLLDKNANPT